MLSESEGKEILQAYGIPVPAGRGGQDGRRGGRSWPTYRLSSGHEDRIARTSHTRPMSAGIAVDLKSDDEVRRSFELIMAQVSSACPGPYRRRLAGEDGHRAGGHRGHGPGRDRSGRCITFGLGGIFVEVMKDVSQRIAPITEEDVDDMIRSIRAYPILTGARGRRPADIAALQEGHIRGRPDRHWTSPRSRSSRSTRSWSVTRARAAARSTRWRRSGG